MALRIIESDEACHDCLRSYARKHSFQPGDTFDITCKGIPLKYVSDAASATLSSNMNPSILLDPVTWAAEVLDWHCLDPNGDVWARKDPVEYAEMMERYPGRQSKYHRPYQAIMLRCSSQFKVFRLGRRAGKCLPSGTLIQMGDGSIKPIEQVQDGELVASVDNNYKSIVTPAFRACNGEKPVLKITLMDGREIEATENHPFLTRTNMGRKTDIDGNRHRVFQDEWKPAEELTSDDYLAVPKNIALSQNRTSIPTEYLTVLGALLADGNITTGNCRFSNTSPVILDRFKNALSYFRCSLKHYACDADCDYHIKGLGIGKVHPVKEWLKNLGLLGLDSHEKYIPDGYMSLCDENIIELLRIMYGCDGWACVSKHGKAEIGYSTVSEKMAGQIVALLARFGIYTDVRIKKTKLNGKVFISRQLTIVRKESIANFYKHIGILSKDDKVKEVYEASQKKGTGFAVEAYEEGDLAFIRIRSIVPTGTKMTWDLSVPATKNFIANNILTHNTECLAISMLFNLFTNSNFKVILITPFQSQIDLVFKRIEELLVSSPMLANSVKRSVKAPNYTVEFHNGSQVKGFTAGTKSGNGAASARGQDANMIVFDEADYLDAADMNASMAIIADHSDATVWMSSTPTGRREKFYATCQDRTWKEFHYPSHINPNWVEKLDALFRKNLTSLGYKHEILADFGEMEEGVFQAGYVDRAVEDYSYSSMWPMSNWIYSIGVDWNSPKIGTTIYITGFNQSNNTFQIVEHATVQRDQWTQMAACQKIVELHRKWRPFAVYVDQGFGSTQIEILRKFGYDARIDPERGPNHIDSKLPRTVKPFDFGSQIEIRDPFTKEKRKKPAKGFLVENAVRRFETGDLHISKEDEQLKRELLGYVIKHVTVTGQVVYTTLDEAIGDHNLDALMLSLVAFTLEKSAMGKPILNEKIIFTPIDGVKESIGPILDITGMPLQPKPARKNTALDKTPEPRGDWQKAKEPTKLWDWPGFGHDRPRPGNSGPGKPSRVLFKRPTAPNKRGSFLGNYDTRYLYICRRYYCSLY